VLTAVSLTANPTSAMNTSATSRDHWRGFHGFRRGLATNLHSLGVEDLTIQKILRHSSGEITRRAYIRTLPEQSVAAMSRLEDKLTAMIQ